jgi:hypothetical protein
MAWWHAARSKWDEGATEHFAGRLTWWDWGNIADALRERVRRFEAEDYTGVFAEGAESNAEARTFREKDLQRMKQIAAIAGEISDLLNQ